MRQPHCYCPATSRSRGISTPSRGSTSPSAPSTSGSETERCIVSVQRLLGRTALSLADSGGRIRPLLLWSTLLVLLVAHTASAQTTFTVSNDAQLRSAMSALSAGDSIVLTNDITLVGNLEPITVDVTIEGHGFTLSGDGRYRGLVVGAGEGVTVYVNDLTIRDAATGGSGGGVPAGAGRGSGLFIANGAAVYANGVSLVSNIATNADTGGALFIQGAR